MAIKDFYPVIRPTLDLNFAGSGVVDPRIAFSRSGTGNVAGYFDEKGVMKFAPSNVPRIDFDPVTSECKGLLIEEQRVNLLTYSEQFENSAWQKGNCTIATNAAIAPNGTTTAEKIVEDSQAQQHYVLKTISVTSGVSYTISVFAKAAERSELFLSFSTYNGTFEAANAYFNLTSGVIRSTVGGCSPVIENAGNGWFRCSISKTATASASSIINCAALSNGSTFFYTGDGTSGIYIWGAQFETGAYATSYIPTTSAQVTRAADTASLSGANLSSWNNTTGTILAKYKKSGWKHNNTPPSTQLDLSKYIQDYSTPVVSDAIERIMFYPRQLTEVQISALKG